MTPNHADQIAFHRGLDAPGAGPTQDPDPDDPREAPHPSHEWAPAGRWIECGACAVRDYYPGAGLACQAKGRGPGTRTISPPWALSTALVTLAADLDAFGAWWRGRPDLGTERPSIEEWAAEFLEWRTGRRKVPA